MAPHDALEIKMEPADEEAPQQPAAGIYILHFVGCLRIIPAILNAWQKKKREKRR